MPSIINATTTTGLVSSADNSGSLQLATNNGTTAVTIDTSQQVGIGTASPASLLHVAGTIRTSSGSNFAQLANNFLRSSAAGSFFYDNATVGQSNEFRTSVSSSLDTTALTLTASGILALRNAATNATGIGITFPATQSASSNANTLDDYEEGTWTPQAWQGSTQITSPNDAYGRYIKIGNVIWIGAYFYKASSAPSASGQWQIRGLPFNVNSVKSGVNAATAGYNGVNGTQSTQVARWQANSSTALELYGQYGTTSWTSSYIEFSFSGCLEAE